MSTYNGLLFARHCKFPYKWPMDSFGFPRHFYLLLYYCLALFIFLLFAFCGKNKLTYLLNLLTNGM